MDSIASGGIFTNLAAWALIAAVVIYGIKSLFGKKNKK